MATALFRRFADTARRTVERVHGEAEVMVRPMDRPAGPNGQRAPSATRPAYPVTACFYEDTIGRNQERPQPIVPGMGGSLMHRTPQLVASIALSEGSPLKTGDLLHRDADRWYEITEITPDGLGGAMVTLAAAKPIPGV